MAGKVMLGRASAVAQQRLALDHVLASPNDMVNGLFGEVPGNVWRFGLTVNL